MGRREGEGPVTVVDDPELRYGRHGRRPFQELSYHNLFDGHRILYKAVVVAHSTYCALLYIADISMTCEPLIHRIH
jgi:hypothetical protein